MYRKCSRQTRLTNLRQLPNWSSLLQQLNRWLTIGATGLALLIVLLPVTPELALAWGQAKARISAAEQPVPVGKNWLQINKILVNAEILEGRDRQTMNAGLWRLPYSSTPANGGNTVIVAHRYLYLAGGKTFYHLDKLKLADKIKIHWQGVIYNYQVSEIKIVRPEQIEIEAPTTEPILTLYTCTPLWSAEKRLVVRAKLLAN